MKKDTIFQAIVKVSRNFLRFKGVGILKYDVRSSNKRAYVICTGPSLNNVIGKLSVSDHIFAVNFFAKSDWFLKIKPKYYCMADPTFADMSPQNNRVEDVVKLYKLMDESVDWDMTLIVPDNLLNDIIKAASFRNPKIIVKAVTSTCFDGNPSITHFLYRNGLAAPRFQTVPIMALFCALNLGYKEILLCGAEHNFIENWRVDDQNNLYITDTHFNTSKYTGLKSPLRGVISDSYSYVREQLEACYYIFRSHELLREYADLLGSKIINTTPNSYIDVYEKKSLESL